MRLWENPGGPSVGVSVHLGSFVLTDCSEGHPETVGTTGKSLMIPKLEAIEVTADVVADLENGGWITQLAAKPAAF